MALLDFIIYDGGNQFISNFVTIKIPDSCCGKTIAINTGSSHPSTLNSYCHTHMRSYPDIWRNFVVNKIHINNSGDVCVPKAIANKTIQLGRSCMKCNEFYSYAEDNQPNGGMICYSCRQNPYR